MKTKVIILLLNLLASTVMFAQNLKDSTLLIQSAITKLEMKISTLEQQNVSYIEIRKLKIQLEDKKQHLNDYIKSREGIDKPIEHGFSYIDETIDSIKKMQGSDDFKTKKIILIICNKIMRFNTNIYHESNDNGEWVYYFSIGTICKCDEVWGSGDRFSHQECKFVKINYNLENYLDDKYYPNFAIKIMKNDALKKDDFEQYVVPNSDSYSYYCKSDSKPLLIEGILVFYNNNAFLKDWCIINK